MSERVLALSVDRYRLTNQKTGEIEILCQLHFTTDYREKSADACGFKPMKTIIDESVFVDLAKHDLPALVEIQNKTVPGKEGKPTTKVVGAKFVRALDIFSDLADVKPLKVAGV